MIRVKLSLPVQALVGVAALVVYVAILSTLVFNNAQLPQIIAPAAFLLIFIFSAMVSGFVPTHQTASGGRYGVPRGFTFGLPGVPDVYQKQAQGRAHYYCLGNRLARRGDRALFCESLSAMKENMLKVEPITAQA